MRSAGGSVCGPNTRNDLKNEGLRAGGWSGRGRGATGSYRQGKDGGQEGCQLGAVVGSADTHDGGDGVQRQALGLRGRPTRKHCSDHVDRARVHDVPVCVVVTGPASVSARTCIKEWMFGSGKKRTVDARPLASENPAQLPRQIHVQLGPRAAGGVLDRGGCQARGHRVLGARCGVVAHERVQVQRHHKRRPIVASLVGRHERGAQRGEQPVRARVELVLHALQSWRSWPGAREMGAGLVSMRLWGNGQGRKRAGP